MDKLITVGIPAFNAEDHISDCLASIMVQSVRDEVSVVIASDNPENNYDFVKDRFPTLDITILSCDHNTGPGLARQRALDACKTQWITFIDADDVFLNPFALENLKNSIIINCIEVQADFLQEVKEGNLSFLEKQQLMQNNCNVPPRYVAKTDIFHPWVFGRLYNVKFLRENKIEFSALRAMEDGEFNWKIRMLIEGSPLQICKISEPVYLWRTGSEHSITRIGADKNGGEPLYNNDLCLVGSSVAAINAIKFCKSRNPFNGGVTRFTTEQMIGHYFSYIKSLEKSPMFADQIFFNAKRFYNLAYKDIENQISDDILKDLYTRQYVGESFSMIGIIPKITFFDFMKRLKNEPFGSKEEFESIRSKLPEWVIELDKKSGVLGDEGYIYATGEEIK